MRHTALALVPLFLLTACADQPVAPVARDASIPLLASQHGVVHRLTIGGPDICAEFGLRPGCDANLSVHALEMADGSVTGQWVDVWGGGGSAGAEIMHAVVTCLEVNEVTTAFGTFKQAWIGGVVTSPQSLAGHRAILRARDRGTSANELADRVSFTIVDPVGVSDDCHAQPNIGMGSFPQGQVSIQ